jgi:hypothetical protein
MDALDKLIADESNELSRLQAAVKAQQIKVDALRLAASARPIATAETSIGIGTKPKSAAKGKPQGAISKVWRDVFHSLFQGSDAFSYGIISKIYTATTDSVVTMAAIRDRVRRFVEQGFLVGNPETGFTLTPLAISKFGLTKDSPNENGAAEATPEAGTEGVAPPYVPFSASQPSWTS